MTIYQIDPSHSAVEFTVRHLVISKVKGRFARFSGEIVLDDKDPARSRARVTIDAASIDTNDAKRDAHLRSPDFFEVEKHPSLTFESRAVEAIPGGFRVAGELTMRGITKPVTLEVESLGTARDPWGNVRIGFSASGTIDRTEWGLTWNAALETGGLLVGEKIQMQFEVEAIQQREQVAAPSPV